MATIFTRNKKNGSLSYHVMIRRKDIPLLCLTFLTYEECVKWAKENEKMYLENPEAYQKWIKKNRLPLKRIREFSKTL